MRGPVFKLNRVLIFLCFLILMCEYYNAFRVEVISCSKIKNAIRFFERQLAEQLGVARWYQRDIPPDMGSMRFPTFLPVSPRFVSIP